MHILVVPSEHFVTEKIPLGGIFQLEQARALAHAGHQVGVIGVGLMSPKYFLRGYPYKEFEVVDGLAVFRGYEKNFIPHRFYPCSILVARYSSLFDRLFKKYIKTKGRPDVIHAHNSLYAGVIARFVQKKYGIPYVVTEHSSAFARGLVLPRMDSLLTDVFNGASSVTCVSSAFKSEIEKRFDISVSVLHNLVDSAFFEEGAIASPKAGFNFMSVASLDANKNLALALTAFASVLRGTTALFTIVGDGPLRDELSQNCKQLGIESQVRFLGRLSRTDVRDQMRRADCLVLSSRYETFGVVLIEAMASGLPVIATRCGGPSDIVNSRNGVLVDNDDLLQMAGAMIQVMENYKAFSPEALRAEALARFGEGAFVCGALALYSRALENTSPKASCDV